MNINQAKAVAGITYAVNNREANSRAEKDCVKLIVLARKSGDDKRSAELSEAKSLFQKRARGGNHCAVCGVTIARGAQRCRIHSKSKAKMISSPHVFSAKIRKGNGNARVDVAPAGGLIARYGFYAPSVQKVLKIWKRSVEKELLQRYFISIASGILDKQRVIDFGIVDYCDLPCAFEIAAEFGRLLADKTKPDYWFLTKGHWLQVSDGCGWMGWGEISEKIHQSGGPKFKISALSKRAEILRILTPEKVGREFRKFVATKNT